MKDEPGSNDQVSPVHPSSFRLHSFARLHPLASGRIYWATLAFLSGFAVLIYVISDWYLLPAFDAARDADPAGKKSLAAHAWLLLAVVLMILVCGILLTFRFGRFFLPRPREPRRPTKYVDAWAESGKRMPTPPRDSEH